MTLLRHDAQHAGHRPLLATRVLALRALGIGVGFLISIPLISILIGMP